LISIQNNSASLHASRQVGASDRAISQSLERLATGKRSTAAPTTHPA